MEKKYLNEEIKINKQTNKLINAKMNKCINE